MLINNRFNTRTTPQEAAFGRLSELGLLSALLERQGEQCEEEHWPHNLSPANVDELYEDYLSGMCWLEFLLNPESAGHTLHRPRHFGEWMQHFEWGLLPYTKIGDFRFQFLHAWLVKLMEEIGTPSIKGLTADEVIR